MTIALESAGPATPYDGVGELPDLLGLLSDPTRLRLLLLLAQGERNVSSLCAAVMLPQPTVSHHLALLRVQGVASVRRDGKHRLYSLDDSRATARDGMLHLSITGGATVRISSPAGRISPAAAAAAAGSGIP